MKTQFDWNKRVVALNNLEAMCKRISGTCHRFTITKTTKDRVYVEYTNPDEYGNNRPIAAVLPAYNTHDNTAVILDPVRFVGARDYEEQAFEQLWDCEPLFRTFENEREKWQTEYEILSPKYPAWAVTSQWRDQCTQVWLCNGSEFKDWPTAQAWAVKAMREFEQENHASRYSLNRP